MPVWKRFSPTLCDRIDKVLGGWVDTPYQEGQRAKRIGVNCTQLGAAVLDELFRVPRGTTFVPRLPADIAIHDARGGWPTVRALRTAHYLMLMVRDDTIEPGDFVVTAAEAAPAPSRQAHLMIAGGTPWRAVHAVRPCVVWTTLAHTRGILRVYRPQRKDLWLS